MTHFIFFWPLPNVGVNYLCGMAAGKAPGSLALVSQPKLVVKCFSCTLTSSCAMLGLSGHAVGKRTCAHHAGKTWRALRWAFAV